MGDKYREPSHTCPDIDRLLRRIDDAVSELKAIQSDVEDLRAANLGIREWGDAWRERATDAEKEVEDLSRQLDAALRETATS